MRYAEFAAEIAAPQCAATATTRPIPRPCFSLAAMMARAAPKAGLGRSGFVDDARRAATPHVIDCNGLSRENLGHQPYRFECELRERTAWCKENSGLCEIEPLRDEKTKVLTGYRFRFEKLVDAVFFKLRFDTQI